MGGEEARNATAIRQSVAALPFAVLPFAALPLWCAASLFEGHLCAQDPAANPALQVVYVGDLQQARGKDFVQFLRAQFAQMAAVERATCTPEQLRRYDVVLLDWPQDKGVSDWLRGEHAGKPMPCPLGELARWDRPSVLLGSAGLSVASLWGIPGGYG